MRIFITGGTGFLGQYVVAALRSAGHHLRCLVRTSAAPEPLNNAGVEWVKGDVLGPLESLMDGCQGVVHLVGIIRENPRRQITFDRLHTQATRHVVQAAQTAGVSHMVHISANGASANGKTPYQTTKWHAEESVRQSKLAHWCILRPGLIFGDPGPSRDEFCSLLARQLIRPLPVTPIFGNGRYAFQPVHVNEVAQAAAQALEMDAANGRTIVCVGRQRLTYVQIVDSITRALSMAPRPKMHLPLWLIQPALRAGGNSLPITADQLTMLLEGNCGDAAEFYDSFMLEEHGFGPDNLAYLRNPA